MNQEISKGLNNAFLGPDEAIKDHSGQISQADFVIESVGSPETDPSITERDINLPSSIITVKLLRPLDLLYLELRFKNFLLKDDKLVKLPGKSLMMAVFQPQSMSEQAGTEQVDKNVIPILPAKMVVSGTCRLVFEVKKTSVALDINELLDWEDYELVVNERAFEDSDIQPAIEGIKPVGEWETLLEIPFSLYLSPTKKAGWKHQIKLKPSGGKFSQAGLLYELWHTRLGSKLSLGGVDESSRTAKQRVLRILWGEGINTDYKASPKNLPDPFLGEVAFNDFSRHQLVHQSSNFSIPKFVPQPVQPEKLFLTTLGGYLSSSFSIDPVQQKAVSEYFSVLKWLHVQTLGREHYVEIVSSGYVMPFGHQASLIDITQRKPDKNSGTSVNLRRRLVIITQPSKQYSYRDGAKKFMQFCFSRLEILNLYSPVLDTPESFADLEKAGTEKPNPERQFIIKSNKAEVVYKIVGEDLNGNTVNFDSTLIFVSNEVLIGGQKNANIAKLIDAYAIFNKNKIMLNGLKVSLAPKEANASETDFAAYQATINIKSYSSVDEPQGFMPILKDITIVEPSTLRLTGLGQPVKVSILDDLKTADEKTNVGRVFAEYEQPQYVLFRGNLNKTGGFASPDFILTGLSKAAGPFGGSVSDFQAGNANAGSYFNTFGLPDPSLFGVFKLSAILDFKPDPGTFDISKPLSTRKTKIPNLVTSETDKEITTSYVLKPDIKDSVGNIVSLTFTNKIDSFKIDTQVVTSKTNGASSFSSTASIKDFQIEILKVFRINFQQIAFTSLAGKSPDVSLDMENPSIHFLGPLQFLNAFQQLIPPDGFSDPPYVDVSTMGVKAGYTLALPNLQLGAFTLCNLSLGAEVNLPFTGAPLIIGFRFCEKQQPFTLAVGILGGGGYFGFEADFHGLRQIDAALEFGAAVSLNLGVASGAVSIMAGIYFKMTLVNKANNVELTGYLRINGAMSIIGLITACIELYMALTYLSDKNKIYGEAKVSLKVHVLFFSKTVTVRTSRTFAGSGKDPNFTQTYNRDQWIEYCEAFD